MTAKRKRGVSKAQWLDAALDMLAEKGAVGITIESLARRVGVAKAGFYWHFRNRDALMADLLEHWIHENSEVIASNPLFMEMPPKERLRTVAETIVDYDLTRYEMSIRQWAAHDELAARAVRRVNRIRMTFIGQAFSELGFDTDQAEIRSRLFVCYGSLEAAMFPELSLKRRRQLIDQHIELLTRR
jgi:AcrR family transcriptional regulator